MEGVVKGSGENSNQGYFSGSETFRKTQRELSAGATETSASPAWVALKVVPVSEESGRVARNVGGGEVK
jgi:hypothetical protein